MEENGVNFNGSQADPGGRRAATFFTQRTLLIGLSVFVFLGIIFGVSRLFSGISSPFIQDTNTVADEATAINEKLVALASQDTDSDGINDFQELYQISTSPYLADSDSDGISDFDEIQAGTNPNCPEGENCTSYLPTNTSQVEAQQNINVNAAPSGDENITASAIRETLKNAGAPQYLLDATSDEELLSLYQDVAGASGSATGTDTNTDSTSTLETLQNFSAQDIRELLTSTGADASLLEQVSDDDLKDIFDQALEEDALLFTSDGTTDTNSTTNTTP